MNFYNFRPETKMALNDEAVSKQIEHMIAFIKNESQEKVEEIYAKVIARCNYSCLGHSQRQTFNHNNREIFLKKYFNPNIFALLYFRFG